MAGNFLAAGRAAEVSIKLQLVVLAMTAAGGSPHGRLTVEQAAQIAERVYDSHHGEVVSLDSALDMVVEVQDQAQKVASAASLVRPGDDGG